MHKLDENINTIPYIKNLLHDGYESDSGRLLGFLLPRDVEEHQRQKLKPKYHTGLRTESVGDIYDKCNLQENTCNLKQPKTEQNNLDDKPVR